ncbi:NAD(P)/FAD-dependent oxidoreductase [Kribbella albertanoniae]|uniref:NAD(P)/FAD-dependent oxidoreductase n=1 Tax=Kribbella albertanoniae TaxID=1266829 RepID=A0A4R4P743_9ACTN|nr:NAD(P)/FAD-dependent oxidoreductase [Kribbella albertanoniae]TDC17799.1 NAD(P)/FAD-dependent oxidoreductase [Kribbella albertanoniae]
MKTTEYDVIVIGGGAAGLSGALALVRSRRSVLVIDNGQPRNAPAGHVHNFLTRDGTPPSEIYAIGREEVAGYGGQFATGTVTAVRRGEVFTVELADGTTYQARRILVTSGLTDVLPDVPGLAEQWGKDVLHCPYCHGWEVQDQAIGVLATSPQAVHQAQMFRQLSDDVTLFLHGTELTDEQWEELAARQIAVVQGKVEQIEVVDGKLTGVRLEGGKVIPRDALTVQAQLRSRAAFLVDLGLETTELEMAGSVYGDAIEVDAKGETAVPGVFAAGNVTEPMAQVVHAAGAGLRAGAAINGDLIAEETRLALAARGS